MFGARLMMTLALAGHGNALAKSPLSPANRVDSFYSGVDNPPCRPLLWPAPPYQAQGA
jgi:hypothetical protein